jgi:uracil-DNA glycosylase family 4
MFTGDRSGDFLYASLFRTGFANQPRAVGLGDGLMLRDCYITAVVRCAPPANRPTTEEIDRCSRWLAPDLMRPGIKAIVALGGVAFGRTIRMGPGLGWEVPHPVRFAHGVEIQLGAGPLLVASYHPSQQNTFTGRLTAEMLDDIFARVRSKIG